MIVLIDLFVRQTKATNMFRSLLFRYFYWHQVQNRNESWPGKGMMRSNDFNCDRNGTEREDVNSFAADD